MRILPLDKPYLLDAQPSLQLLLARDGRNDIVELFYMHQPRDAVSRREGVPVDHVAVVDQTSFEIAGDADVEDSSEAGEDVDVIELHASEATLAWAALPDVARLPPHT